jgi:hypothetical protein
MNSSFSDKNGSDAIATRLREEAQAFNPTPPADMRRRVFSVLAGVESPDAHSGRGAVLRWLFAAGVVATAAVVAAMMLREHPDAGSRPHSPSRDRLVVGPGSSYSGAANPFALTLRFVDDPLEGEMQNLLSDLSRTSSTVARVLPGTTKRQKAATQGPAGV